MAAQPLRRLDPTAGDADLDPAPGQVGTAAAMVVGLVGVDLGRAAAPAAGRGLHLGEVVQQRLEHQAVVGIGPSHQQRQRQATTLNGQVQLGAGLGPVDRVCATQVPP